MDLAYAKYPDFESLHEQAEFRRLVSEPLARLVASSQTPAPR